MKKCLKSENRPVFAKPHFIRTIPYRAKNTEIGRFWKKWPKSAKVKKKTFGQKKKTFGPENGPKKRGPRKTSFP
jgi:hypothetical protein